MLFVPMTITTGNPTKWQHRPGDRGGGGLGGAVGLGEGRDAGGSQGSARREDASMANALLRGGLGRVVYWGGERPGL